PDLPERGREWNADQPKNTNENYKQDENKLPLELGIHAGSLTLFRIGLKARDSISRNFYFQLVGDAQLQRVILKPDDRSIDAAIGDDLVGVLQIFQHLGDLLLPLLSRHDHQEIEDHHDQNQRKKQGDA